MRDEVDKQIGFFLCIDVEKNTKSLLRFEEMEERSIFILGMSKWALYTTVLESEYEQRFSIYV